MDSIVFLQCNETNATICCEWFRVNFQMWYGNFLKKTVVKTMNVCFLFWIPDMSEPLLRVGSLSTIEI